MSTPRYDIVIIGGGPGGLSAARWCESLGLSYALVDASSKLGGQLLFANHSIRDYVGLPVDLGTELAARMEAHALSGTGTFLRGETVHTVDVQQRCVSIGSRILHGRTLLLAQGARPRALGVPGEATHLSAPWRMGLPKDVTSEHHVVVVGGGDNAADAALAAAKRGARVSMILRGSAMRVRSHRTRTLEDTPGIQIFYEAKITRMDERHVWFERAIDGLTRLEADRILIRIGFVPNSELVKAQVACDSQGYVVTDKSCMTSVNGIAAIGDITNGAGSSSVVAAVGQGMIATKALARVLDSAA